MRSSRPGRDMQAIQQRFTEALDVLVDHVKRDRSILAAFLCGSLSHDVVWEKSDIDLLLVTIDDRNVAASDVPLDADGVNVRAILAPPAQRGEANSRMEEWLDKVMVERTGPDCNGARSRDQAAVYDQRPQHLRAGTASFGRA